MDQSNPAPQDEENQGSEECSEEKINDLLPLFRILIKRPFQDHDCMTCPICKQYGITEF